MADELNPAAQGTPAEAIGQQTPPAVTEQVSQAQQEQSGFQKRIDELTAKFREQERRADEYRQLNETMMSQFLARSAAAVPTAPAVEIEPEEKAKMDAYFNPLKTQYESQIAAMQARFEQQEFAATAARYEDPRVGERAAQLLAQWKAKKLGGWQAQDAFTYAAGELALQDRQKATQARDERGRFNGAVPPTVQAHAAPAVARPDASAVPGDIDSWPADKQAEFYEKRLNGKIW